MDRRSFDVVVVGNGVLGASTALALLEREPKIRLGLIGARSRPYGASAAAGAMHGCFGEATRTLLDTEHGRTKLGMAVEATRRWPAWLEVIHGPRKQGRGAIQTGTFVIQNARSGSVEGASFEAIRQAANEHGAPCEEVDPATIPGLEPSPDTRPIRAVYLPTEGWIDASLLLSDLDAALDRHASFTRVDDEATGLVAAGGRIDALTLRSGAVVSARRVLLAAGVKTQSLVETIPDVARRTPRLFAGVGVSLLVEGERATFEHVIRTANRAFSCSLHVVPRSGNRFYVGATNRIQDAPAGPAAPMGDLRSLLTSVMRQIHEGLGASRVHAVQVGNRPVSADACPLVGETSVEGLFLLTGTYRDGLHLSPLLAADVAERMLGRSPIVEHGFAPERRLISLRTRAEAIDEAARQLMASDVERGGGSTHVGESVEEACFVRAKRIYDGMSCEAVMPVDLIPMVEQAPGPMSSYLDAYYRSFEAAWR